MIAEHHVLRAVKIFRYVTRRILTLFFGGETRRIKALERMLPALERGGLLFSQRHRGEKVYSIPRKKKGRPVSIAHELACALILIQLWRCRMEEESEIVPERAFRGFGIVPEAGIRYSEDRNTMLEIEYCSLMNSIHGVIKSKLTRHKKYLPAMEQKFKRNITVLFVIDIERDKVRKLVARMQPILNEPIFSSFAGSLKREVGSVADAPADGDGFPSYPFFFTDYQTFKSVPVGEALTAKIYFWNDGKEWRLTNND